MLIKKYIDLVSLYSFEFGPRNKDHAIFGCFWFMVAKAKKISDAEDNFQNL
jgi:hypothetical protein